ncbi:MAG: epoxide hydrolase [Sphingomonadaceae bacterium]|uniref:epoxide hydrolase family protein n=1 Tax=Thermaurantiacus sp. TaxID=2820283 RepID=UPI00298F3636|nr:epoxide hydrolase [Thermaurantiacus sp.]MCS6987253.1 epoxide hydrolase [Sphingomonadaceae bacterium]MDW8414473.1 epoxide hydrolase [Thermaurantiacus sp.]
MPVITPFTVPAKLEEVAWILRRVEEWRPFPEPRDHGWEHGANMAFMGRLRERWLTGFDWPGVVRHLNRLPQVRVALDGAPTLHAIHLRSSRADARPLLLLHGWPGSVLEFDALYQRLAEPEDPTHPAFHVVAPSLPGYAWSDPPSVPLGPRAVAGLMDRLMAALGYPRYLVQGGDWGSVIGAWLALDAPGVLGLHLNSFGLRPADMTATTEAEAQWLAWARSVRATETAYLVLQATKPQSLAFAMMDSPMGVAAWIAEKYHGWCDRGGQDAPPVPLDTLIATVMIYLVTRSFATSTWLYRGMALEGGFTMPADRRVEVPTAVAAFPYDLLAFPPRPMVERGYRVVRWTDMPRGGHFAALEAPDLLLDDLRAFAADLG